MSPPTSVDARPHASNGEGPGALAARVANATTRLIVIAVVAGGLLTAAMNLWEPGLPVAGATGPTSTDAVARAEESPLAGLPVAYRQVQGDEAAARNVTVGFCREALTARNERSAKATAGDDGKRPADGLHTEGWLELDRDPAREWSVHEMPDVPRRIVGVSRRAGETLICCWGGYDQTGPDEWTVWTMRLPQPEK